MKCFNKIRSFGMVLLLLIIIFFSNLGSIDPEGYKQKLKTDQLERLELALRGCDGKCAENGYRVVALNKN